MAPENFEHFEGGLRITPKLKLLIEEKILGCNLENTFHQTIVLYNRELQDEHPNHDQLGEFLSAQMNREVVASYYDGDLYITIHPKTK